MRALRVGLILAGIGFVGWGVAGLFAEQSASDLFGLAVWLGGALLAHDGVLVPLTLLLGLVGWRLLRRLASPVRQILAGGTMVAGMLTLLAVPSIIRAPIASNPSALPQHYGRNLALLLLVVGGLTAAAALWAALRARRGPTDERG